MPTESNHGLSFSQETFLTIRRDGKPEAIELQNGHIERYMVEPATRGKTLELFGADRINSAV